MHTYLNMVLFYALCFVMQASVSVCDGLLWPVVHIHCHYTFSVIVLTITISLHSAFLFSYSDPSLSTVATVVRLSGRVVLPAVV